MPIISEYEAHSHVLLHLSDTHLLDGDKQLYGDVDADKRLAEIFENISSSGAKIDAMVFTGDIADKGEIGAYSKIRKMVDRLAENLDSEIVWVMGNHDDRSNFRQELLDSSPSSDPVDSVHDINGLRVIALDTTVPGEHYGAITQNQHDWLAEVLSSPSEHGSVLALHHPPMPSFLPNATTVELRGQKDLRNIITNSDIRSIIGGHMHYSSFATFAGIPVSVASSTCYTQDLNFGIAGNTHGQDSAQGFNIIHVYDDTLVHSVIANTRGKLVGDHIALQDAQKNIADSGIEVRG